MAMRNQKNENIIKYDSASQVFFSLYIQKCAIPPDEKMDTLGDGFHVLKTS